MKFLLFFLGAISVARAAGPIPYTPAPNDSYFEEQWYLENLNTNGVRRGFDINARSAWSFSRGEGVTIAIVDDGVELAHPELTNNAAADLHWNFFTDTPNGNHALDQHIHGTPVAGLAIAEGNNARGISGVAPEARFASWVIYNTNRAGGSNFVPPAQLARMFEFKINDVQVQNHSWVKPGSRLTTMSAEESLAISNAVVNGRGGKGVVIVRAVGNGRSQGRNANEDAYTADPRAITVGAIRFTGRVASYSTPGASILVSSIGGELGTGTLFTTDRLAQKGYNQIIFPGDLSDYVFQALGFQGTSAVAPLVSGISALMLSENPNLTYRDVQHILVQAAFQTDFDDPEVKLTPAGLNVSHHTGFGLVNAGTALELASAWKGVPSATSITNSVAREIAVPDAGLNVTFSVGGAAPINIPALPSLGIHPDVNTPVLPLVHVGLAVDRVTTNLSGKGALIQRGGTNFATKIENAARAGAEFAIIYNDRATNILEIMSETEFVTIPAVFISQANGEELARLTTNETVTAALTLQTVNYEFTVTEPLVCEQVQVKVDAAHQLRGDMRITLVSPMGTRSVLQTLGPDTSAIDGEWTYMSTHHFYETSQGTWRLYFSDEGSGSTGNVRSASLVIHGMRIKDTDADGLDDDWEQAKLGNLTSGLGDDPDRDGYSNAREQVQGTEPRTDDSVLAVDLSKWNDSIIRLNWPSINGATYEVLGTEDLAKPFESIATVGGGFPRSAWLGPVESGYRFFTVREFAP